ncbi:hypothetical protein [Bradyrhizobium sp. 137]|uniref:hypothetical protein n=1 Tax=Bradyrhizobium sp. 137 TaxID=2782614 RepID=UPI001FF93A7B|nr:hypothetical protein [Bradyrhizobium sp. 137]
MRADLIDGSRGSFSEQVLELGKDLFDRVQLGRVFRHQEEFGAYQTDELANGIAPVATEIVQDEAGGGAGSRLDLRKLTPSIGASMNHGASIR